MIRREELRTRVQFSVLAKPGIGLFRWGLFIVVSLLNEFFLPFNCTASLSLSQLQLQLQLQLQTTIRLFSGEAKTTSFSCGATLWGSSGTTRGYRPTTKARFHPLPIWKT
jgi:hypothetical protein